MFYSFDVFDTLITRRTATPEGIFVLMQERLTAGELPDIPVSMRVNFCELRIHAEELVRHSDCTGGVEDVSLDRIYEALSLHCGLHIKEKNALADMERRLEAENIIGIRQNINKVLKLLDEGSRVVLISDMYLDQETVKGLLGRVNPRLAELSLYVSSTYGKGKWSGNLFKIVKDKEQVRYEDWQHCGDNRYSDVEIPGRLGIQTVYFAGSELKEIDKQLLKKGAGSGYLQRSIGVARNLLVQEECSTAKKIGISQGGPILYAYVWWILDECCRQGIHRLYFIARDGYILKQIAEIIVEQYEYGIELYYLYGSRKAWRMAGFSPGRGSVFNLVRWSHTFDIRTPADLAEVFQIEADELLPWLFGGNGISKETYLSQEILYALTTHLDADMRFQNFLAEKHREKRKIVRDYLKQEISLNGGKYALVDLAGGGYTQTCLADIMKEFTDMPIQTFYFKMDCVRQDENSIYQVFIPGYLKSNLLIEMFGRASHGQTCSYMRNGEKIVPVLEKVEEKAIEQQGVKAYLSGVEDYAEHFTGCLKDDRRRGDNTIVVLHYFEYITNTPDEETLDFWGSMPNGVTGREQKPEEYAPALTEKMAWKIYFAHDREHVPVQEFYHGSDPRYSFMRSSPGVRRRITLYQKHYHSIAGRVVRCFTHPSRSRQAAKLGLYRDFPVNYLYGSIVLYGCGKYGQYLFDRIMKYGKGKCSIVLWVDSQPDRLIKGRRIESPECIRDTVYDTVVIGVIKPDLAKEIKDFLVDSDVPENKILWLNLWKNINQIWE